MVEIAQAGITSIICDPKDYITPRWTEDENSPGVTEMIMVETGIRYREVK